MNEIIWREADGYWFSTVMNGLWACVWDFSTQTHPNGKPFHWGVRRILSADSRKEGFAATLDEAQEAAGKALLALTGRPVSLDDELADGAGS